MNPQLVLLLINTSLTTLTQLLPEIQKLRTSGEISEEEQRLVKERLELLRSQVPSGPEWDIASTK